MKNKLNYLLIAYIAVLLIIALTNNPLELLFGLFGKGTPTAKGIDINNLYHFSAYFILGILAAFTLKQNKQKKFIILTIFLALIIGSADELLQIFSPQRIPDFLDITYDFFGVLSSQLFFINKRGNSK